MRRSVVFVALCLSALAGMPARASASVSVPRTLDGATVSYAFSYERDPTLEITKRTGSGTLEMAVDGDAPVPDAGGGTQRARVWEMRASGFADLASEQWQDLDGVLRYALDPVSGRPVRATLDGDVTWSNVGSPRLRYRTALNHLGMFAESSDSLLPLARFLDALGGRPYGEGQRMVGAPGNAQFVEAGTVQPLDLVPGPGRGEPGKMPERIQALPLDFVLGTAGGVEVSGTAWLQDGEALPAKLELRYHAPLLGRDVAGLTLTRVARVEGASLPSLPAFVHPSTHPDAQTGDALSTGTAASSFTPEPTIEEVLALGAAHPSVAAYRASYPSTFPAIVLEQDTGPYAALLGTFSSDAKDLADLVFGQPFWMTIWYAEENPGVAIQTAVFRDRATGEWTAAASAGAAFLSTSHPARTLTLRSAYSIMEEALPALREDGRSPLVLAWLAYPDVWLAQRHTGLDPDAVAADPRRLLDTLAPQGPQACGYLAPPPGGTAAVEGSGRIVGTIEATYVDAPQADQDTAVACARTLANILDLDPLDPDTIPRLARDVDGASKAALTYADATHRPRPPIVIRSDADLTLPSSVSGVTGGTGTRDDPYVISGWNIRPPDAGTEDAAAAVTIRTTTKHVVVRDNVVQGTGYGMWIERARNVRVESNTLYAVDLGIGVFGLAGGAITGNVVDTAGVGIHVQNHVVIDSTTFKIAATPVTDLVVSGNRVDRADAAMAYFGTYGTLARNEIADNTFASSDYGLAMIDAHETLVRANRYSANGIGLLLQRGGRDVVSRDDVAGSSRAHGVYLLAATGGARIEGARVEDGGGYGVFAYASAASIDGASIDANARGVVAVAGSVVTVTDSALTGGTFGVHSYLASVQATGNWWGAADGPSGCAHGSGTRISCGIAYQPFRTSS